MSVVCKLLGHRPGTEVRNEGLYFATCSRCHADIIRQRDSAWSTVPRGLRVAWHPADHQGLHWSKAISRARKTNSKARP